MMQQTTAKKPELVGANAIFSFWEGKIPELVLRCIQSMRIHNQDRPVIVLNKETLFDYLDEDDFPLFNGVRGNCESFEKVQYLADWVRLTLLEKYGGVWLDASVICLNNVQTWISDDESQVTMFPMHANPNIHGNWAFASPTPGNPVIKAWREEMAQVLNEAGEQKAPIEYIARAFETHPALDELWNKPAPPPLPYLWPYLTLQVTLQKQPELHHDITLLSSTEGPMYRRYLNNPDGKPCEWISDRTANHLAMFPIKKQAHDKYFIKLVGTDRKPVEDRLNDKRYIAGSALHYFSKVAPRPIRYGVNLNEDEKANSRRASTIEVEELEVLCSWAASCLGEAGKAPLSQTSLSDLLKQQRTHARRSSLVASAA